MRVLLHPPRSGLDEDCALCTTTHRHVEAQATLAFGASDAHLQADLPHSLSSIAHYKDSTAHSHDRDGNRNSAARKTQSKEKGMAPGQLAE